VRGKDDVVTPDEVWDDLQVPEGELLERGCKYCTSTTIPISPVRKEMNPTYNPEFQKERTTLCTRFVNTYPTFCSTLSFFCVSSL
jgi:hypothetical protein